jgi:predicted RNase H-like HicB family nuclease
VDRGPILSRVRLTIEMDREEDGRFIAEVRELPGVMAYGATEAGATAAVKALALRVLAERFEHGELASDVSSVRFDDAHAA